MEPGKEQKGLVYAGWVLPAGVIVSTAALLKEIFDASHWPFVHDSPFLHYIIFLMSKGFIPYRDIIDMNMPGAYLFESFGMHVFGAGARGWFLWDLVWVGMIVLGSVWIAGAERRAAGMIAACVTSTIHLSDGAVNLGQRDWVVAGLLILAFGCMFQMLRSGHVVWLGGAALLVTSAASVKPPAILFVLLLLGALASREYKGAKRALLWMASGFLAPMIAVVFFLLKWHAAGAFADTIKSLVPYYASVQRVPFPMLIWPILGRIEKLFLLAAVGALILFILRRGWSKFGSAALPLGALGGAATYILQDKGWAYQRYPAIAFVSLFIAMEIESGIRDRGLDPAQGPRKWIAWSMLAIMAAILPCAALYREKQSTYRTGTMNHLESDLAGMGGAKLSNRVQCLDMTHGECINVLYRLQLVQSTGFIYDFYLFPKVPTALTNDLQNRFMWQIAANPPKAFVISDQDWVEGSSGYDRLARWPAFSGFLAQNYQLETQFNAGSADMAGYRIYVLR